MSLYVGLDVGTQSVKLLAYDPALGEVVATAARPMQLVSRDDGTREQDARWWIDGIVACFADGAGNSLHPLSPEEMRAAFILQIADPSNFTTYFPVIFDL